MDIRLSISSLRSLVNTKDNQKDKLDLLVGETSIGNLLYLFI